MESLRRAILPLVIATLCAPMAQADGFVNTGGYMIIGGSTGFQHFQDAGDADFDDTNGFRIRGGYRMSPIWSFELDGEFLDGFDTKVEFEDPDLPDHAGDLAIDTGIITANVKAYLPMTGRFQPYALLGAGGMWATLRTDYTVATVCSPGYYGWYCSGAYGKLDDGSAFAMRGGIGFDLYMTEGIAFTMDASYVYPFGDLEDLQYTSLGWALRFQF